MKKKIAYILVALLIAVAGIGLGVGAFNNLNSNEPNTEVQGDGNEDNLSDEDLMKKAVAYVKTIYKDVAKETAADYERIGTVPVGKAKFTVDWSVDVDENIIKIVKQENGMVTIDINEEIGDETPYVLTATISDGKGNKESLTWDHVIPAKITGSYQEIVDMAYALKNGESLPNVATLQGTVTTVNTPWDSGYKNITVTIVVEGREDKPIQCYRLKSGAADASQIEKGDLITVTGTLKNYNGTIEFDAGCVLDENLKGQGKINKVSGTMLEIVAMAYKLKPGQMLDGEATLAGSVISVDTEWNKQYKNITVTIVVDGSDKAHKIMCYRLKSGAADASKVEAGDHITVTGMIKNYNGTIEFDAGCVLDKLVKGGGTVAVDPKPEPIQPTEPSSVLKTGDKIVFYAIDYMLALSADRTSSTSYYNKAIPVELSGKTLTGYTAAEVYTVTRNEDGTYTFTNYNGDKLSMDDEHNSIQNSAANDRWNLLEYDGYYMLQNTVHTENYLEYSSFGNWDTIPSNKSYFDEGRCKLQIYFDYKVPRPDAPVVPEEPVKEATLDDAVAALKIDKNTTSGYYSLADSVKVGEKKFPVKWNVVVADEDVVKIVDGILVINASNEAAVEYKLVATISDGSETATKEATITVAREWTAAEVFEAAADLEETDSLEEPETVILTGTVKKINTAYDAKYGNVTVTMSVKVDDDTTKEIQCYRLEGDGVDEIKKDSIIKVKGSIATYKGTLQFASGCELMDYTTTDDIELVEQAYALTGDATLEDVTLSGIITDVKDAYSSQYGNISVYITTLTQEDKPILCYRLKGVGAPNYEVGDRITVNGNIVNYNDTIEFESGCVVPLPETDEEIVDLAFTLVDGEKFYKDVTLNGEITKITEAYNEQYGNISVEMTVMGTDGEKTLTCYRMIGTGIDKLAVGDKILVTGTLKNHNGTIEFDKNCTLDFVLPRTEKEIVDFAFSSLLEDGDSLPIEASLAGVVTSINGKSISMEVDGTDGKKTIICYNLKGDGVDTLVVGDLIRVNGILTNYEGAIQFKSGSQLENYTDVESISVINAAYELTGTDTLAATLSGKIVSIDTPYDSGYGNVTVTISFAGMEDKPIMCFRLKGVYAKDLEVGDRITVTGTIKNYNGTIEFDSGCKLVETMSGIVSAIDTEYKDGVITVTMDVDDEKIQCYQLAVDSANDIALGDTIIVTGPFVYNNNAKQFGKGSVLDESYSPKEIVDLAYALEKGQSLAFPARLTGEIVSVDTEYSTQYKNVTVTIAVEGTNGVKNIQCYKLSGEGADVIKVGDEITVTGIIKNFGETIEFNGCVLNSYTPAETTENTAVSMVANVAAIKEDEE